MLHLNKNSHNYNCIISNKSIRLLHRGIMAHAPDTDVRQTERLSRGTDYPSVNGSHYPASRQALFLLGHGGPL